jgi:hypothetical protein
VCDDGGAFSLIGLYYTLATAGGQCNVVTTWSLRILKLVTTAVLITKGEHRFVYPARTTKESSHAAKSDTAHAVSFEDHFPKCKELSLKGGRDS